MSKLHWARRYRHASVVFDGKLWVIGGATNDVWSSEDGACWLRVTDSAPWAPRFGHASVVFKDKIWVIGGGDWAHGGKNDVWSTENVADWTEVLSAAPWPVSSALTAVVFDDKMWVIGFFATDDSTATTTLFNAVWSSEDGISWIEVNNQPAWAPRVGYRLVVHEGQLWVIGGSDMGDVWVSTDGVSWTQVVERGALVATDGPRQCRLRR